MARNLNDVVGRLPKARRARIAKRTQEMLAEIESHCDVGMVQPRQYAGLPAETLSGFLIRENSGRKDFYGHVAVELLVASTKHDTHATFAYLLEEAIVTQQDANRGQLSSHVPE